MEEQIDWRLFIIVAIAALVVVSIFIISSNVQNEKTQRFFAAEDKNDKCKTPAGYADKEWKEHMSHHPEQYAGCLG